MNPFYEAVEDTFRTQKVRVVARDGTEYVGWLDRMEYGQEHVLLHGAERDGEHVGAVMVRHADRVERVEPFEVRELAVAQIRPSPYAVKRFDAEQNLQYIRDTHDHDAIKSYPLVRPVADGMYEVVDGHKALWVCDVAEVTHQPCRVIDCGPLTALKRFAFDHFPLSHNTDDETTYTDEEVRASIRVMLDDFDATTLKQVYPIDYNLHRLGMETPNR